MGEIIKFEPRKNDGNIEKASIEKDSDKQVDTRRSYLFERKKTFKEYVKTVAQELDTFRFALRDNFIDKDQPKWKENIKSLYEVLQNLKTDAESLYNEQGENDPDRERLTIMINRISFAQSVLSIDLDKHRAILVVLKQLKEYLEKA